MLSISAVEQAAEAREAARVKKKQLMNEERLKRMKMGVRGLVDVAALDAQVEEKQKVKAYEHQEELMWAEQVKEIDRVLAQDNNMQESNRALVRDELHRSWEQAIELKKARDAYVEPAYDYSIAGVSSLLYFEGQKNDKQEMRRKRMEVNATLDMQVQDKIRARQQALDSKNDDYILLQAIDTIRQDAEDQEEKYRQITKKEFADANLSAAQQNKDSLASMRAEAKKPNQMYPNIIEDKRHAFDASGRIIRRDNFKGFTSKMQQDFLDDNARIMEDNRQRKYEDERMEAEWAAQMEAQSTVLKGVEEEEMREKEVRRREGHIMIQQQLDLRRQKAADYKDEFRGNSMEAFLDNFGNNPR